MKLRALLFALITCTCFALASHATDAASPLVPAADAGKLVASEHAFAAMARGQGVRRAFMEWLAPTGVLFRPGPVIGRRFYEAGRDDPGLLEWDPDHAVMSASGDMGWTTGPWAFRTDSSKAQPDAYGQFVTVWRRQPDGSWRAALDAGSGHAAPNAPVTSRVIRTLQAAPAAGRRPLAERKTLWQVDADYVKLARAEGPAAALAAHASPDVIVLRDDATRWAGSAARDSVAAHEPSVSMMSTAQFMSQAGDLGYTYGTYVVPRAADADSGHYVHIWERDASRAWKLALELVTPMPKRR